MVKKRQRKHFIFVFCFFVFCCNKVRLGKAFLQSWKALPCPICKEHCICGMGTATVDACTMCQMLNACAKQFILLLLQTLFQYFLGGPLLGKTLPEALKYHISSVKFFFSIPTGLFSLFHRCFSWLHCFKDMYLDFRIVFISCPIRFQPPSVAKPISSAGPLFSNYISNETISFTNQISNFSSQCQSAGL